MEAKLREYRALRRRKELMEKAKHKLEESKEKIVNFLTPNIFKNMNREKEDDEIVLLDDYEEHNEETVQPKTLIQPEEQISMTSEVSDQESLEKPSLGCRRKSIIRWVFYITLWLLFYLFFLRIQFGAVYFVVTLLVGIYLNTRTQPRRIGEVSAYSVFNENCQSIDGTLKAEQFEREIRYGAGSVR